MLGPPKPRCLDQPILASLEDLVPRDNFYRYLDAKLDLSFVRTWVQELYAERGRPSLDPVVFFKLQLILFFEGLRSERKLMETTSLHLAHRWYLGYRLDEPLPDHSSLTKIRQRLGLPLFQRFFDHVVELCQAAGLVWGKELFFDATQVRANAHVDSLMPRWYLEAKAHLDALFPGTAAAADDPDPVTAPPETASVLAGGAGQTGPGAVATTADPAQVPGTPPLLLADAAAPAALPFRGTPEEDEALAAVNRSAWRLLERFRLSRERPTTRGYHRTSDDWESITDPDAAPMKQGGPLVLGYQDHYAVDGGTARIILAAFVTPGDVMENKPLLDLLWRVRFRGHLHPRWAIGDATYGTIENIRAGEDAGIRAYLAMRSTEGRTPFYSARRFHYDAERDEYRCRQGEALTFERVKWTEDVKVYRGNPGVCWSCPLRKHCTDSADGRIIHRSLYAEYVERVKGYAATDAYKKARRKRSVWVEPLLGEAKDWHGRRRFRFGGLWKVKTEALLVAAGQNLKRWLKQTGWGRRHGPAGSLALSPALPV